MVIDAKVILGAAMAGLFSAFAFIAIFSGSPLGFLLGITSPIPLFYTAFTSGVVGTGIAAGVGFFLMALQTPAEISGGGYFIGLAATPLFVAWWLERSGAFFSTKAVSGKTLGDMVSIVAIAASLIIAFSLLSIDRALSSQGGLVELGQDFIFAIIDEFAAGTKMPSGDVAQLKADILAAGKWLFVDTGARWLMFTALGAGVAARLAKRSGKFSGGKMRALVLPRWFAIPLLSATILSLLGGALGFSMGVIAMTLGAASALHGLSVVHSLSRGLRLRPLILGSIYGVCYIYLPAAILLALLGLTDSRMNLRNIS